MERAPGQRQEDAGRGGIAVTADDSVGPWAREKLDALDRYLTFFNRVLKKQAWCKERIFVDAFAGPGRSPVRGRSAKNSKSSGADALSFFQDAVTDAEAIQYVHGSPKVALDIPDPFTRYIFIELDPQRLARLEETRTEYGSTRQIELVSQDANRAIEQLCAKNRFRKQDTRAVVFLDPFGMQISWTTIHRLAQTRAVEVIINFPLGMAIQRMLTKSGQLPAGWDAALDKYFGSPEWRDQVYERTNDLLGGAEHKRSDAAARLLEWYRRRLREAFGFVSTARLISNTRGSPLYYLIWAGPHAKGKEGADHILKMGRATKPGSIAD